MYDMMQKIYDHIIDTRTKANYAELEYEAAYIFRKAVKVVLAIFSSVMVAIWMSNAEIAVWACLSVVVSQVCNTILELTPYKERFAMLKRVNYDLNALCIEMENYYRDATIKNIKDQELSDKLTDYRKKTAEILKEKDALDDVIIYSHIFARKAEKRAVKVTKNVLTFQIKS